MAHHRTLALLLCAALPAAAAARVGAPVAALSRPVDDAPRLRRAHNGGLAAGSRVPQAQFWVSPSGSDTAGDGTFVAPWQTLPHAQAAVRSLLPTQTGDVYVWARAGAYALGPTPWSFTLADSAAPGCTVHYAAWPADDAPVTVHGAAVLPPGTWRQVNASAGGQAVWSAPAPSPPSRQLFFDDVGRAQRAGFPVSSFVWNLTETGYVVPASSGGAELLAWWAAQPVGVNGTADGFELVFTGSGSTWTEPRCRTASIQASVGGGDAVVTVVQPCFSTARGRGAAWQHVKTPVSVENVRAAVTQPGTFFYASTTGTLYYAPLPGQDMGATVAHVPTLEQLLDVRGTFDATTGQGTRFTGLSFEGLTFAYSTWLLPSSGVGFVDNQGPDIYVPGGTALVPAALQVHGSAAVSFLRVSLYGLGSTGLAVDGGSQNVSFVNGTVTFVAGVGIQLGGVTDGSQWDPALRNGGHLIHNSYFTSTPAEYHGGSPIFGGHLRDTTYSHNYLYRPPNGGICSGWGWGAVNNSYSGNVTILNNRVEGSNWLLEDCGSFYVNGHNTGSLAQGNYALGQVKLFGALYPDEGSTNWLWIGNVAEDVPEPIHIWTLSIQNITMTQNYYGPSDANTLNGTDMHVYNNTWVAPGNSWPPEAEAIKALAGLLPR